MAEIGDNYAANQPIIRHHKQKVRLWFEFYKLALQDDSLKHLLQSSREYYSDWGDVEKIGFDLWWSTHKHLFPPAEVEILTGKVNSKTTLTLNLSVPLNQSTNLTIKQIKSILHEAKLKSAEFSVPAYTFTKNNFNGPIINQMLELYRYYLIANKPSIGKNFVVGYLEDYLRPKKRQKWVPKLFWEVYAEYRRGDDIANSMDSIRKNTYRYIRSAEKLKIAAAIGKFPGKYL